MKLNKVLFLLFITAVIPVFAQIKGVIVDSKNQPIPYVSIAVANENIGTTSEEDGSFILRISDTSKTILFSALGYEKYSAKASNIQKVILQETEYALDEVIISKRLDTKTKEIGETNSAISQAFDNGPKIDTKFFPFSDSYKKTKYLKKVSIITDNKVDGATIKLHFYSVGENGQPSEELLRKDVLLTLKIGVNKTWIDVSKYNLKFPQTGLFIGYEKLLIERNKLETQVKDSNTGNLKTKITYYPFVLYNFVDREFSYTFTGGNWIKNSKTDSANKPIKSKVYEPSLNILLSN